ncbi:MAG: hypothetical protein JSR91_17555 [Proteobacteria bacterium]|nr:hypothetical protein [Pseudomonadota bacterium]
MPRPHDRAWLGLLVRYIVLIAALFFITFIAYTVVGAENRLLVLRLAVATFACVALVDIRRHHGQRAEETSPSQFERALHEEAPDVTVAPILRRLQEELKFSTASRRYFKNVLWPRLEELAKVAGVHGHVPEPMARAWPRRGLSLQTIANAIDRIGSVR